MALHAVYSMDPNDSAEEDVDDAFPEFMGEHSQAAHFQAALEETIRAHWAKITRETEKAQADTDFTRHDLPLARIKRIMSQDSCENPQMLGRDSPAVTAYGCELLIRVLTKRAWAFTELAGRHTLQKRDLLCAVMSHESFDFLIDIVAGEMAKMEAHRSVSNQLEQ